MTRTEKELARQEKELNKHCVLYGIITILIITIAVFMGIYVFDFTIYNGGKCKECQGNMVYIEQSVVADEILNIYHCQDCYHKVMTNFKMD